MYPSVLTRFMKKLTLGRVEPIISARVSCVIDGTSVFDAPGFPF
jgi:hypothetical protein